MSQRQKIATKEERNKVGDFLCRALTENAREREPLDHSSDGLQIWGKHRKALVFVLHLLELAGVEYRAAVGNKAIQHALQAAHIAFVR